MPFILHRPNRAMVRDQTISKGVLAVAAAQFHFAV
jgi:hypothetical protein